MKILCWYVYVYANNRYAPIPSVENIFHIVMITDFDSLL